MLMTCKLVMILSLLVLQVRSEEEEKSKKWLGEDYFLVSHPSLSTCTSLSPCSSSVCRSISGGNGCQNILGKIPLSSLSVSQWRVTMIELPVNTNGCTYMYVGTVGNVESIPSNSNTTRVPTACVWGYSNHVYVNGVCDEGRGGWGSSNSVKGWQRGDVGNITYNPSSSLLSLSHIRNNITSTYTISTSSSSPKYLNFCFHNAGTKFAVEML